MANRPSASHTAASAQVVEEMRSEDSSHRDTNNEHPRDLHYGPAPKDVDRQCKLCSSLSIESLVGDHGGEGKLYGLDTLIDSASSCEICARLFDLERMRLVSKHSEEERSNGIRITFGLPVHRGGDHSFGRLDIDYDPPAQHIRYWSGRVASYAVFTNEGDVASTKYHLQTLQAMGVDTSSDRSFETAKQWLHAFVWTVIRGPNHG